MAELKGHYTVIGPPGTGKTTWLAKRVREICEGSIAGTLAGRSPVLVCSLTKAAAAEAAGRGLPIPKEAVATMHAHGYRTMEGVVLVTGKMIDEVFNKKNPGLAITPEDIELGDDEVMGDPVKGDSIGDYWKSEYHLYRHKMTPRSEWTRPVQVWAKKWEEFKQQQDAIDYTDMIEFASCEPPFDPKVVICDEAQDMSRLEIFKLKQWGDAAGCLITVGDPWQALYVWRGADPDHLMRDKHENPDHFGVLSQSWRIPQKVHTVATNWIKNLTNYEPIEYRPKENAVGHVEELEMSRFNQPQEVIRHAMGRVAEGKSVMLQVTCNHMTSTLVHYLREEGVPFSNPWRMRNHRWNPMSLRRGITMRQRVEALLKAARPVHGDDRTMWTLSEMFYWANIMKATGCFRRGAKKKMKEAVKNYPDCRFDDQHRREWFVESTLTESSPFDTIWRWFESTDAGVSVPIASLLDAWISHLETDKQKSAAYIRDVVVKQGAEHLSHEPKVYIGTIHSFKGGEADCVYLWPDVSPRSMEGYSQGGGEEHDSVIRAFYVGITRAKEELYICEPSNANTVELL